MSVLSNLEKIISEINAVCKKVNRNSNEIKIVAVTKYVSIERASEAINAGIIHIGENRTEGILEKWALLKERAIWHFIGSLQTRKVKEIINLVDYIHSLDRMSLAAEINKRASKPIKCFVQVNVSGENTKQGISPDEVIDFVGHLKEFPNIIVEGLMTMAPFTNDEGTLRHCFKTLKELQVNVKKKGWSHAPCQELSMGMSNDYVIAIEEGATIVRIGTALVGEEEVEV